MVMNLKGTGINLEKYNAKRDVFVNLVKENADKEKQDEAYINMVNAMAEDTVAAAEKSGIKAAEQKFDELSNYKNKGLNSKEVKFFNEINTETGYKEETLLPETTIDKIFDDMVQERPLLQEIGVKPNGLRMRVIKSDPKGQAVWGKIFGEIKGQLDAAFTEEEINQNKLTAFVVVPTDLEEYGPVWVERFVRLQITEAFAVALEAAIVSGDGNEKPVGLNRQVQKGVSVSGGVYPEKDAETDELTFADSKTTVKELSKVMKDLSTKEDKKKVTIDGKVVMLVNPSNAWSIKAQHTTQTANGLYVTALPFNIRVVESEFVKADTVIAFVNDRYDAYVAGGIKIKKFDQTLALEDCLLYTAKQFAYGKAEDNNAAKVYTLNIGTPLP